MAKLQYYKLYGGIGNQLFQYAHGLSEISKGEKIRFILNREFNSSVFYDLPELFNVDPKLIYIPQNLYGLLAAKVYAKYICRSWNTGFFQEYKYGKYLKNAGISFSRKAEYQVTEASSIISDKNSISIHIRGGDYNRADVFRDYGNICTEDYYNKAAAEICTAIEKPFFVVFTNDLEYASSILKKTSIKDFVFAENLIQDEQSELRDDPAFSMYLQTLCKANIIANSTFSWWGAFLNERQDKLVISPSKWHNKRPEVIEKLVPDISGWRKL